MHITLNLLAMNDFALQATPDSQRRRWKEAASFSLCSTLQLEARSEVAPGKIWEEGEGEESGRGKRADYNNDFEDWYIKDLDQLNLRVNMEVIAIFTQPNPVVSRPGSPPKWRRLPKNRPASFFFSSSEVHISTEPPKSEIIEALGRCRQIWRQRLTHWYTSTP